MFLFRDETWKAKAEAKTNATLGKIAPEWRLSSKELEKAAQQRDLTGPFIEQYLEEEELRIIKLDATTLVSKLRKGEFTAKEVTLAFCKTAAVAHQINNNLHEIFFEQAIQRAEELDRYYHEHGTTVGLLHGLPVSLKDQFHVKGNDTTMGYIGWIGTYEGNKDPDLVHKINSQVVSELLELGAILYCKTSLPQTLLFGETVNNLIGRTLNPNNQNLSCGGSSGGEGALQVLRGSLVGFGTDIGGSVRIPAAFNGIFSIRPTHTRLPYRNVANVIPGETTYPSTIGILGTSLGAIELVFSAVLSRQPWLNDPVLAPISWRQSLLDETLARAAPDGSANGNTPLKLGIYWTDNVVTPQPPIQRGLRIVVDAVRKAGHKIVEWQPPDQRTAKRIHLAFLKADGGHDIHKQLRLSGEPLIPQLRETFRLRDPMSLITYQELTVEGRDYEGAYADYWNSTAESDGQLVDAVIMPVAPHAAVIPGKYYHTAYTESINLLDYSAVVIPVTKADKSIDIADPNYTPLNDVDAKNWAAYDADIYDGAPVGVQLVARKYDEEKILAVGRIVYQILKTAGAR
ncbi:amidase [Lojkania enalia]|uniref:Amidase n=1 Tax=Lojkania enalia TaxID=147567 RepID=A0A9P4K805_9PLEO|nr:amidase [Didymosphaeria enalia]